MPLFSVLFLSTLGFWKQRAEALCFLMTVSVIDYISVSIFESEENQYVVGWEIAIVGEVYLSDICSMI